MSIKTTLAFLNSDIFAYFYRKKFSDIKVLKSNLTTIPFPKITPQQDLEITQMVNLILKGNKDVEKDINEYIFHIYELTPKMVTKIKEELYGNTINRT